MLIRCTSCGCCACYVSIKKGPGISVLHGRNTQQVSLSIRKSPTLQNGQKLPFTHLLGGKCNFNITILFIFKCPAQMNYSPMYLPLKPHKTLLEVSNNIVIIYITIFSLLYEISTSSQKLFLFLLLIKEVFKKISETNFI